jgi:hypothetical protein
LAEGQKDGVSTTIHPKTNSSFAERSYLLGRRPKRQLNFNSKNSIIFAAFYIS